MPTTGLLDPLPREQCDLIQDELKTDRLGIMIIDEIDPGLFGRIDHRLRDIIVYPSQRRLKCIFQESIDLRWLRIQRI